MGAGAGAGAVAVAVRGDGSSMTVDRWLDSGCGRAMFALSLILLLFDCDKSDFVESESRICCNRRSEGENSP